MYMFVCVCACVCSVCVCVCIRMCDSVYIGPCVYVMYVLCMHGVVTCVY